MSAELIENQPEIFAQQHVEVVAQYYCKAPSIAREPAAKLWQLRASLTLARLQYDQEHHSETRDLLAPAHRWFNEGFGSADLEEPKPLYDELGDA